MCLWVAPADLAVLTLDLRIAGKEQLPVGADGDEENQARVVERVVVGGGDASEELDPGAVEASDETLDRSGFRQECSAPLCVWPLARPV